MLKLPQNKIFILISYCGDWNDKESALVWSLGWENPLEKGMATHSLVILPWGLHGQRSLVGYSPWSRKGSDMTERLPLLYFQSVMVSCIHIGGYSIGAKQYREVWKQLAFMGTILFFPYPFFFKLWKWSQFFFFKTMQLLKTLGKDSLGWIFFFFSFWEKKVSCINRVYIFVQTFIVFEY